MLSCRASPKILLRKHAVTLPRLELPAHYVATKCVKALDQPKLQKEKSEDKLHNLNTMGSTTYHRDVAPAT
ncbi:hypothetical protein FOB58_000656 [Candida parapsilosis]|uniref:Uncharacterized protein n=1 Tax=Candida parapsilosis TaxID=5480 RepID=A0A8X7NT48_CANPA|nr:hypothetical protein FOB58_000656 [Candida parapsilosis]KAF6056240.1 hypothetical protein FOB59_000752 [Candida parapsilosis]KAF6059173.1 hypothetical protein FOB60_000755 [Candida parapsilosis]KAF6067930.1 hypothetical protein FOB61_000755 [Candida parapsilosis]KAI5903609.1 hypothetical protein K4G60_g2764 [Candida parapsilosis]